MPQNPLRLKSIHHVKFVVGNAKQAAYYYRKAFGFSQFAYSGLETGSRDLACYAMEQGKARFVLATPYRATSPEAAHLHAHGDGIVDIAFHVEDADAAYHAAVERGAEPALHPTTLTRPVRVGPAQRHQDLRRHHPLVLLVPRLHRAVPARVRRPRGSGAGRRHPAGRSHGRQRRTRQDGLLGRLVQQGPRLRPLHQLRRQGHLDRIQRAHEHRDERQLVRHQVSAQRAGAPASARARSTSTWTSTTARACSTSRC